MFLVVPSNKLQGHHITYRGPYIRVSAYNGLVDGDYLLCVRVSIFFLSSAVREFDFLFQFIVARNYRQNGKSLPGVRSQAVTFRTFDLMSLYINLLLRLIVFIYNLLSISNPYNLSFTKFLSLKNDYLM